MIGRTHLLFGLLLGVLAVFFFDVNLWFFAAVLLGSLVPDLDEQRSILGRRVRIFSWLFEHRGICHSIFFWALFALLFFVVLGDLDVFLGFTIGFASHLLLDSLTRQGIVLFPTKIRLRGFLRSGGIFDYLIFYGCIVVIIVFIVKLVW